MRIDEIEILLSKLDGSGSNAEYSAIESLKNTGELPTLLLEKYRRSKKWNERVSCVFHAIRYAKEWDDAFILGVEALKDKSKVVRYRAAMLLAVSQRRESIPHLQQLLSSNNESALDIQAAVNAIESENINLFLDRDGSGMVSLRVQSVGR